ncbi:MAG: GatB/YqeY domain-containing protein [bacterium]|nr:GatB/YqeY domain-containing protein [bacterium]
MQTPVEGLDFVFKERNKMLKEQINADLKTAMLARDSFASNTIKGLKAAILNEEVAKNKREEGLNDSEIEAVVAREVKKRKEAAVLLDEDRAENELKEAEILSKYLPEMASEEEIREFVRAEIAKLEEKSIKQMGAIMGISKVKFGNSADGALLSKIVKEELN